MDAKRKKIYIAILAIAVIVVLVAGLVFIGMKKEPAPLDPEMMLLMSALRFHQGQQLLLSDRHWRITESLLTQKDFAAGRN